MYAADSERKCYLRDAFLHDKRRLLVSRPPGLGDNGFAHAQVAMAIREGCHYGAAVQCSTLTTFERHRHELPNPKSYTHCACSTALPHENTSVARDKVEPGRRGENMQPDDKQTFSFLLYCLTCSPPDRVQCKAARWHHNSKNTSTSVPADPERPAIYVQLNHGSWCLPLFARSRVYLTATPSGHRLHGICNTYYMCVLMRL